MSEIITPGQAVLFMKVGTHAQETLEDIIARKTKEIDDEGWALWGYGGNTCHPRTMVQPFAKKFEKLGQTIYLCMQPMDSRHFAEQVRADEYSEDGLTWVPIPKGINVLGSRYALKIQGLKSADIKLPVDLTKVAVGNSRGAIGSRYISGRVDKACLEISAELDAQSHQDSDRLVQIGLVAKVVAPHAVFLRNR